MQKFKSEPYESEIDLKECKHFLKAKLNRSEIEFSLRVSNLLSDH